MRELGRRQQKESFLPCFELHWLTAHTLWECFPLGRALKFIDRCCISYPQIRLNSVDFPHLFPPNWSSCTSSMTSQLVSLVSLLPPWHTSYSLGGVTLLEPICCYATALLKELQEPPPLPMAWFNETLCISGLYASLNHYSPVLLQCLILTVNSVGS